VRRLDLFEHRLEPIFELTSILRARHERTHVQRAHSLILQRFRHVSRDDAPRYALYNRRFPTPGSPINTGLFFVLRDSTCITRRTSSSRPITGSVLPRCAACVRSRQYFSRASNLLSGSGSVTRCVPRTPASAPSSRSWSTFPSCSAIALSPEPLPIQSAPPRRTRREAAWPRLPHPE